MPRPRCLLRALLALLLACSAAACGERSASRMDTPGGWLRAWVPGLERVSAMAVHEDTLLLLDGPGRRVLALARADLAPGTALVGRELALEVQREVPLEGQELDVERGQGLAAQGYRLGTLWAQPLDLVGLATRRMRSGRRGADLEAAYVLERSYGVVWSGRLERDERGQLAVLRLQAAAVVPGRPRAGAAQLDWRDSTPGLCALAMASEAASREDLVLLEAPSAPGASATMHLLDRFGQRLGRWQVEVEAAAGAPPPELRALAWDGREHRLLLGPGAGELRTLPGPGAAVRVAASGALAAPTPPAGSAFTALACSEDGLVLLAGSQPGGVALAWRVR